MSLWGGGAGALTAVPHHRLLAVYGEEGSASRIRQCPEEWPLKGVPITAQGTLPLTPPLAVPPAQGSCTR